MKLPEGQEQVTPAAGSCSSCAGCSGGVFHSMTDTEELRRAQGSISCGTACPDGSGQQGSAAATTRVGRACD